MDTIAFGRVLRQQPLGQERGINASWRAVVQVGIDRQTVIAKQLPDREILVECLCALLARALDLPAPRPLILAGLDGTTLFGSELLPHPDLRRCGIPDHDLAAHLSNWRDLPKAATFDGWIVNHDRHRGNLLTDGIGGFWLIDHGLALAPGLPDDVRARNFLLDFVALNASDDLRRRRLLNAIKIACAECAAVPLDSVSRWAGSDMLSFLQCRLAHLWPLLRLEITGNHELPGL